MANMKLFAFDTALGACSVSCFVGGEEQATHFEPMPRGHAEVLMDHLAKVEAASGIAIAEADAIAVTVGPGTFTGVRVGLAAAKAFALATNKPVLGVSSLSALAAQVTPDRSREEDTVAVAIDARRSQIYFQLFDAQLAPVSEAGALDPAAASQAVADRCRQGHRTRVIGSGAQILASELTEPVDNAVFDTSDRQPSAREVARIASAIPIGDWPARVAPLYLRPPDAKPQKPSLFVQRHEKNV